VTSPQEAVRLGIGAVHRRKRGAQRADRFERLGCAALEALIALDGLLPRAADGVDGAATPSVRGPGVGNTSTLF
jgi:hypothetical protein